MRSTLLTSIRATPSLVWVFLALRLVLSCKLLVASAVGALGSVWRFDMAARGSEQGPVNLVFDR